MTPRSVAAVTMNNALACSRPWPRCLSGKRNGQWEFQAFNADKSVNRNENLDRCFSCHKPKAAQDFVWTLERMKTAP